MKSPKLPDELFSVLGPLRVSLMSADEARRKGALGIFLPDSWEVKLDKGSAENIQRLTLFHEWAHVAFFTSGVENTLTAEQLEAVCDAIALLLATAERAGYLRLTQPK